MSCSTTRSSTGSWGRNPVTKKGVPVPRVPKRAKEHHTADEVRQLLEHHRADPLYPALVVFATTGMRRGELLALQRDDVDLENRSIEISKSVNEFGHVNEPKTDAGMRTIRIDEQTTAMLRRHLAAQAKERLRLGEVYDDHGLLFAKPDGTPIPPRWFSVRFQRMCAQAGVRRFGPHSLRHAADIEASEQAHRGTAWSFLADDHRIHVREGDYRDGPGGRRRDGEADPGLAVPGLRARISGLFGRW
jgi:integrase